MGEPMEPVWYKGFVWHWTKDNSIGPNAGMRLLDLARRNGWLSRQADSKARLPRFFKDVPWQACGYPFTHYSK